MPGKSNASRQKVIVNKWERRYWEWIMDHKKEFLSLNATLANNYMSIQTNKQTHRQTHRKIDTHTDKQTDTRAHRQTDTQKD